MVTHHQQGFYGPHISLKPGTSGRVPGFFNFKSQGVLSGAILRLFYWPHSLHDKLSLPHLHFLPPS